MWPNSFSVKIWLHLASFCFYDFRIFHFMVFCFFIDLVFFLSSLQSSAFMLWMLAFLFRNIQPYLWLPDLICEQFRLFKLVSFLNKVARVCLFKLECPAIKYATLTFRGSRSEGQWGYKQASEEPLQYVSCSAEPSLHSKLSLLIFVWDVKLWFDPNFWVDLWPPFFAFWHFWFYRFWLFHFYVFGFCVITVSLFFFEVDACGAVPIRVCYYLWNIFLKKCYMKHFFMNYYLWNSLFCLLV